MKGRGSPVCLPKGFISSRGGLEGDEGKESSRWAGRSTATSSASSDGGGVLVLWTSKDVSFREGKKGKDEV